MTAVITAPTLRFAIVRVPSCIGASTTQARSLHGPKVLGFQEEGKDWLIDVAATRIKQRIAQYQSDQSARDELRFNLMAVLPDRTEELKIRAETGDTEALEDLQNLENKKMKWKLENQRRVHDYTPFLLQALQSLAKKGQLVQSFDNAETRKNVSQ